MDLMDLIDLTGGFNGFRESRSRDTAEFWFEAGLSAEFAVSL